MELVAFIPTLFPFQNKNCRADMAAAGSAVVCGGLSNESSELYFLSPNSKGFRYLLGKQKCFDVGRAPSLSLDRATFSLPCPIMRRRKAVFSRMNSPDCSVESDDVDETVALKQESHPSYQPKYDSSTIFSFNPSYLFRKGEWGFLRAFYCSIELLGSSWVSIGFILC